jgi:hypothetical protein
MPILVLQVAAYSSPACAECVHRFRQVLPTLHGILLSSSNTRHSIASSMHISPCPCALLRQPGTILRLRGSLQHREGPSIKDLMCSIWASFAHLEVRAPLRLGITISLSRILLPSIACRAGKFWPASSRYLTRCPARCAPPPSCTCGDRGGGAFSGDGTGGACARARVLQQRLRGESHAPTRVIHPNHPSQCFRVIIEPSHQYPKHVSVRGILV